MLSGARVAQPVKLSSVRLLVLAQVTISQLVTSSPTSDCLLTVWSLLGILSPPRSENKQRHILKKEKK